jgi:hypothetical protein
MGSSKLAVGILVMFVAMVFFFFAFHPGGVAGPNGANVSNPTQMLQFLISEFQKGAGITAQTDATLTSAEQTASNYPGYTAGTASTSSNTPDAVA